MNIFLFLVIFLIVFMLLLIWKEIGSLVFPHMFLRVEILTKDNSIKRVIELRGKDNFKFKGNEYFYTDLDPYYEKGLRKYYFKEGDRFPLNFRKVMLERNLELEKKFFEKNISDMLNGGSNKLTNFFKEYGTIIIIMGLGILGLMIYKGQNGG